MKNPRNHDAGFKARVALEAVKGERSVSELATNYGVNPTMVHLWKKALLEGAADIFERGGKRVPEIDEDTVQPLLAKIIELTVAKDFFIQKVQALDRQMRCAMFNKKHPSLSLGVDYLNRVVQLSSSLSNR
jgi:transposase